MAHDVFVSHSVKDKAVAEKIVARLEAESVRCWVAPRDVVPGADWGESIIDAIESSRIMVLIFSQNANGSTQIKREVERAVDKNVYTIPFRVEDIEPTRSLEYFISTSQWMDAFTPPLEQHLGKLAQTVKAILARAPAFATEIGKPPIRRDETPAQARDSAPHSPVWLKPVAVVAGLLILGAAIWYYADQKRTRSGKEKSKSSAVADTSLLTLSPTAASPPQNSNSAPNQAVDGANQPQVANQAANARVQPPSKMMNQSAEPVASISPTRQNLAAESTPPNDDSRAARDLDGTTWNHNGSTVVLRRDGSRFSFVYRQVRPGLQGIVPDGATLFEGVAVGNRYSGKARRFKKGLPPIDYDVSGGTLDGGRVIELKGKAPMRNDSGTITGYTMETLRFENSGSAEYRAEEPSAVVRRYYDSINRRDLTQAYDCLSKGFKAHSPMNKFAQIFASTQSIEVRNLQENSRDDAKAVVTVSFVEVDAENRSREWERRVALVKEGDAWRIDGTQSTPR